MHDGMSCHDAHPPLSATAALRRFLDRVNAFCEATGKPETAVSRAVLHNTRRIGEIRGGNSSISVRLLDAADAKLSEMAAAAGITLPDGQSANQPARAAGENLSAAAPTLPQHERAHSLSPRPAKKGPAHGQQHQADQGAEEAPQGQISRAG